MTLKLLIATNYKNLAKKGVYKTDASKYVITVECAHVEKQLRQAYGSLKSIEQ